MTVEFAFAAAAAPRPRAVALRVARRQFARRSAEVFLRRTLTLRVLCKKELSTLVAAEESGSCDPAEPAYLHALHD